MTAQCDGPTMPRHCAERFEDISRTLGKIDRMAEDVRALRKAVAGNGNTERSLAFRVGCLEQNCERATSARARWGRRIWKSLMAVLLVLFGAWIRSTRH